MDKVHTMPVTGNQSAFDTGDRDQVGPRGGGAKEAGGGANEAVSEPPLPPPKESTAPSPPAKEEAAPAQAEAAPVKMGAAPAKAPETTFTITVEKSATNNRIGLD